MLNFILSPSQKSMIFDSPLPEGAFGAVQTWCNKCTFVRLYTKNALRKFPQGSF